MKQKTGKKKKSQVVFFENILQIVKPLPEMTKKKKDKTQITTTKNY